MLPRDVVNSPDYPHQRRGESRVKESNQRSIGNGAVPQLHMRVL
ncbi:MAG TPA: hypothetical protein VFH01_01685 [Pyrinomonadaceae bacterium]|nr:hypothetical protein [Pyrinomonadaceae bacterium]